VASLVAGTGLAKLLYRTTWRKAALAWSAAALFWVVLAWLAAMRGYDLGRLF